jgi:hypothetical protein
MTDQLIGWRIALVVLPCGKYFLDYTKSLYFHYKRSMIGFWEEGRWFWELKWRRNFFSWEEELVDQLLTLIDTVKVTRANDSWVYRFHNGGVGMLDIVDDHGIFMANTSWPNHSTRPPDLLHLLC